MIPTSIILHANGIPGICNLQAGCCCMWSQRTSLLMSRIALRVKMTGLSVGAWKPWGTTNLFAHTGSYSIKPSLGGNHCLWCRTHAIFNAIFNAKRVDIRYDQKNRSPALSTKQEQMRTQSSDPIYGYWLAWNPHSWEMSLENHRKEPTSCACWLTTSCN